ncbi:VIT1/CCC1 family protein [Homoserinimonas sp. OAct 916]|uniref:VIT1/CCC1 transporter family protein n=1 Tax=Homoserinimonas sp. OAct 916 TaxID=2211450 RepID=UPI000DBE2EB3|nr:VIT1/CCC1 family protein [Homoserinimonas sp. OAct 916]
MTHHSAPPADDPRASASSAPTAADIARWKLYLADERAEAAVYRDLAQRRAGEEREILLALAEAEGRHAAHWETLLGEDAAGVTKPRLRSRVLGFFTRQFGSVFVLALAQRAEARSPYSRDHDATQSMAADERIHEEVVRGLAARGRNRLSGSFRAAVFGMNDGLVSNLALMLGVGATGVPTGAVLIAGLAGLLAGALSMGAGEYVSVRSQRELLEASSPNSDTSTAYPHLDVNANELALVYRARGMSADEATAQANAVLRGHSIDPGSMDPGSMDPGSMDPHSADPHARSAAGGALAAAQAEEPTDEHETIGTAFGAAMASFWFFASGAIIPVLPYLFGMEGIPAQLVATGLVGIALLVTGAVVGLLSGGPPLRRALRQLTIGFGAAAVTWLLGLVLGRTIG